MLPTEITEHCRVHKGKKFALADCDPKDTCGLDIEKAEAKELLALGVFATRAVQGRILASLSVTWSDRSLLTIFRLWAAWPLPTH